MAARRFPSFDLKQQADGASKLSLLDRSPGSSTGSAATTIRRRSHALATSKCRSTFCLVRYSRFCATNIYTCSVRCDMRVRGRAANANQLYPGNRTNKEGIAKGQSMDARESTYEPFYRYCSYIGRHGNSTRRLLHVHPARQR